MNKRQRKTIVVALLVIALMLLVPPMRMGSGFISYKFLFQRGDLSVQTLVLQILMVAALAAGFIVWSNGKRT